MLLVCPVVYEGNLSLGKHSRIDGSVSNGQDMVLQNSFFVNGRVVGSASDYTASCSCCAYPCVGFHNVLVFLLSPCRVICVVFIHTDTHTLAIARDKMFLCGGMGAGPIESQREGEYQPKVR